VGSPKFLPIDGRGILFFGRVDLGAADDAGRMLPARSRPQLGEYVLPDGWVVIAARQPGIGTRRAFAMPRLCATGLSISNSKPT